MQGGAAGAWGWDGGMEDVGREAESLSQDLSSFTLPLMSSDNIPHSSSVGTSSGGATGSSGGAAVGGAPRGASPRRFV